MINQVPFIWSEWQPLAAEEYNEQERKWEGDEAKRMRRLERGQGRVGDTRAKPKLCKRMHEDDHWCFLNLAACLKVILARSVQLVDLERAQALLHTFLLGFLEV